MASEWRKVLPKAKHYPKAPIRIVYSGHLGVIRIFRPPFDLFYYTHKDS